MKNKVKRWIRDLYAIKHNLKEIHKQQTELETDEINLQGTSLSSWFSYELCISAIKLLKKYFSVDKSLMTEYIIEVDDWIYRYGCFDDITTIVYFFDLHLKVKYNLVDTRLEIYDSTFEYFAQDKYFYNQFLRSFNNNCNELLTEKIIFDKMLPGEFTLNGLNQLPLFMKDLNNAEIFIQEVIDFNLSEYDRYIFRKNVLTDKQVYNLLNINQYINKYPAWVVLCAFEGLHSYEIEMCLLDKFTNKDWKNLEDINVFKYCKKEAEHYKFVQQNFIID